MTMIRNKIRKRRQELNMSRVHHHREGGNDDVGESFGKIEGRNPHRLLLQIMRMESAIRNRIFLLR